ICEPTDKEMEQLYKDCYAVLFTAFNEDFGLTLLEAMSQGKPVVAVNRGGPIEVVFHQETGLLVDCEVQAFSCAMEFLVEHPSLATQMGKNGLERCKNFTWDTFVEKIDRYLDELERERGQTSPCYV